MFCALFFVNGIYTTSHIVECYIVSNILNKSVNFAAPTVYPWISKTVSHVTYLRVVSVLFSCRAVDRWAAPSGPMLFNVKL